MNEWRRREVITSSAGALALLIGKLPVFAQLSRLGSSRTAPLDWRMFIEQLAALANHGTAAWDEEAYVVSAGSLLRRVRRPPKPEGHRRTEFGLPAFYDLERRVTFEVKLLSFDPGDRLPAHDHPEMTGVMTCVSGELLVESYEKVSVDRCSSACLVKKVRHVLLASRDVSTLTGRRANIHRVSTTTGCEVVDVFTPPYSERSARATQWFSIERDPYGRSPDIFRANVTS